MPRARPPVRPLIASHMCCLKTRTTPDGGRVTDRPPSRSRQRAGAPDRRTGARGQDHPRRPRTPRPRHAHPRAIPTHRPRRNRVRERAPRTRTRTRRRMTDHPNHRPGDVDATVNTVETPGGWGVREVDKHRQTSPRVFRERNASLERRIRTFRSSEGGEATIRRARCRHRRAVTARRPPQPFASHPRGGRCSATPNASLRPSRFYLGRRWTTCSSRSQLTAGLSHRRKHD